MALLSQKDQRAVIVLIAALVLFFFVQFVFFPLLA